MANTFDPSQIAKDFEAQTRLSPDKKQAILANAQAIDANDAFTSTGFGAKEQRDLGELSDFLLKRASGSALEDAVDAIYTLQEQISGLDLASLQEPQGFWAGLFSPAKRKYAALRKDYTQITYLIDRLANQIDLAGLALQKETALLDTLYESNLKCYRALESKILVGKQALTIAKQDNAANDTFASGSFIDLFQNRLLQLQQSQTVSLQLALQIRLTQYNQQSVMKKLRQLTDVALPLWQNQLALALNINKQQEALGAYRKAAKQATEAMNKTKQTLHEGKKVTREESEQILSQLEQLKEADLELKELLRETLQSAQQAKTQ